MSDKFAELNNLIADYKKNIRDVKPIANIAISTVAKIRAWSSTRRELSAGAELYTKMSRKDPLIANLQRIKDNHIPEMLDEYQIWTKEGKKALEYPGSIYTPTNLADYWSINNSGMSEEMYEAIFFTQLEHAERYKRTQITYESKFTTPRFTKTSMFPEIEMANVNARELAGNILYPKWINPTLNSYDEKIRNDILNRVAKGKPILNDDEFVQLIQTLTNKKKKDIVTSYDFDETTLWAFDLYSSRFYKPTLVTNIDSKDLVSSSQLERVCQFLVNRVWQMNGGEGKLKELRKLIETSSFHGRKISDYNLSMFSAYQNMCRLTIGLPGTSVMPSSGLICARETSAKIRTITVKGRMIQVVVGQSILRGEYKQRFFYTVKRTGGKRLDSQYIITVTHDSRLKECSKELIKDFLFDVMFECKIEMLFNIFPGHRFPIGKDIRTILYRIWANLDPEKVETILINVFGGPNRLYGLTSTLDFDINSMNKVVMLENTISDKTEEVHLDENLSLYRGKPKEGILPIWDSSLNSVIINSGTFPIGLHISDIEIHTTDFILRKIVAFAEKYQGVFLELLFKTGIEKMTNNSGEIYDNSKEIMEFDIKCSPMLKTNWMTHKANKYSKQNLAGTVLIYFSKPGNVLGVTVNNQKISWGSNNFKHIHKSEYMILGNLYDPTKKTTFRIMKTIATPQETIALMIGTELDVLRSGKAHLVKENNKLFKAVRTDEFHDVDDTLTSIYNEHTTLLKRRHPNSPPGEDQEYYFDVPSPKYAKFSPQSPMMTSSDDEQFGFEIDSPERYAE